MAGAARRSWHNESLQPFVRALGESAGWGEGILRGSASVSAENGGELAVEVPGRPWARVNREEIG